MTERVSPPVFVIGDVHGNLDRLERLLDVAEVDDKDCVVVQLGDLGNFGTATRGTDLETWRRVYEGIFGVDIVLWGNHDRAVVDSWHRFGGYAAPFGPDIKHMMRTMEAEGRLKMAYEAHGWLVTHAGLHAQFKYQKADVDKEDPAAVADWINERALAEREAVIDAIGTRRGGPHPVGGVLWRDIGEKLYPAFPQVFGHSANRKHKVRGEQDKWWCVDIGGKGGAKDPKADCIAGIWLPSQEVVRVDMNYDYERP